MRTRRVALVALTALVIAGCGEDADGTGPGSTTAPATAEPALPDPIAAEGAQRAKLTDRVRRELEIPDNPDWMVSAFGALWVKRDNGDVMRIDPANGRVLAEIGAGRFEEPLCQGLGASEDAIWSCPPRGEPGGTVVRIDPDRDAVVSTLRTRKMPDQGRLVSAADRLWLLVDGGQSLIGVDLKTEQPSAEIALGETCTDLASAGTTVWAACPIEGHVMRIDAESAEIEATGNFPGARTASAGDDLWVGFDGGVAQAAPQSLEVTAVYDVHPDLTGAIYAADDEVWVREEGKRFLTRIDPEGERIAEIIEAPGDTSGGDVVVIGASVWATAGNDGRLYEVGR